MQAKKSAAHKVIHKMAAKKVSLKPEPVKADQPSQAQAYYVQRKNQKKGS